MERRAIRVGGIVQGVGFRPFVHALATRLNLGGWVCNTAGGVEIEVEGEPAALEEFLGDLLASPPSRARIERLSWQPRPSRGESGFIVEASRPGTTDDVFVSPDVATCADCLAELFDPHDHRYRYPFLNCTNCGPRLTIIEAAPYDRRRTTMADFPMCPRCRAEYDDPANRRFHAEATACPDCGPRLSLLDAAGNAIESDDPLRTFAAALRAGRIGAVKGVGGFHLACNATSVAAVEELRRRKQRDEKPFALMVRDLATAAELCTINETEQTLLASPQSPIVLLHRRAQSKVTDAVAPRNPFLGLMLPSTPLHHLLLREMGGMPLVMTSGNRANEPIAFRDADVTDRLGGIADLILTHDRRIHVRCDDSVTRVLAGVESPLRRSRGAAPQPVRLPETCRCPGPILAVGGQLKSTFALGRDQQAFLSHHLGDLDEFEAARAFSDEIALYERLFSLRPGCIAHDPHPDSASTRYAAERAAREGIELVAVQHHHAHMASCMAEHGLPGPVIGVTFDGSGYGTDGTIWGGEFLVGDYRGFRRAAHLREFRLPGGDRAIREPWRAGAACLIESGCDLSLLESRIDPRSLRTIRTMIERDVNSPRTSSMGRLFDAVAALAGVRDRVSHEGQAAMELEWLAGDGLPDNVYPYSLNSETNHEGEAKLVIDSRPLIRAVVDDCARGTPAALIARRFHSTLVELVAAVCGRLRAGCGLNVVVLSGGVFQNVLLTTEVASRLDGDGFDVYRHRQVPPNDGGLSLGQLAVAACR